MQAAHTAGLVHRDLKPANILVADHADDLHPYVLDFGIARVEELAGLTITGQVMGTPGYLSPEQARGDLDAIDRRTDVFSLGVILYEFLGGARPFDGDSNVEILLNLIEDDPRPLRKIAPHIPRDLNTIVMTCLEKAPERTLPVGAGALRRPRPVPQRRARPRQANRSPRPGPAQGETEPAHRDGGGCAVLAMLILAGLGVNERRTAARRADLAQNLGREVERMVGLLDHAYLLPLHDIRPDQSRVRDRMAAIDGRIGPSIPPLGR